MASQPGSPPARFTYRPELDGVRAVAILSVIVFHGFFTGVRPRFAGILGVDIFFVLSGYLITTLLLDEDRHRGTISLSSFYARRALRLFPALVVMLIVGGLVAAAIGQPPDTLSYPRAVLYVVTYVGNWALQDLGILSHAWSLAIEEQFYLLWPPILWVCLRRGVSRRTLAAALVAISIALALLEAKWGRVPPIEHNLVTDVAVATYARSIGIMLGSALALVPELWRWARHGAVAFIAAGGATAIMVSHRFKETFHFRYGFALFALLVTVFIAHIAHRRNGVSIRVLRAKPLVWTGKVSYGLYLYHVPIFYWIGQERFVDLGPQSMALASALTVAMTLLSWFVVERPALRLKQRFERRSESASSIAAEAAAVLERVETERRAMAREAVVSRTRKPKTPTP